ncbi:hypothetical protein [Aestuariivirga litoralis]|uniref:hypothetical protein n=1 Tax=Aestuariivirga litoralis TaxID=2650924 RepID=UPI00137AE3D1|nr:hypothetical protein [Aestuariivirga litoralis]
MKNDTEDLRSWTGNIDELARKVAALLGASGAEDADPPSVRLVRDYLQRGLLGQAARSGKELSFGYENLLRFVATRVLLRDGWNLGKISEHLDQFSMEELEAFLPKTENRALAALGRIRRMSFASMDAPPPAATFMRRAVALTPLQNEMKTALQRLGLPEDGPATEAVILMAITPWFQALVQSDRISRITPEEADEIGRAVTASLIKLSRRKEFRK